MAMITAITDVQDSDGNSVVIANPDGTRPPLVMKLGAGLAGSYVKSGDQGIVTVTPSGGSAALAGGSLTLGSQTPSQAQVDVGVETSAATSAATLVQVTVPTGKSVGIELHVFASISVPALGFVTVAKWRAVIDVTNVAGTIYSAPSPQVSALGTSLFAPFGRSSIFTGLGGTIVGNVCTTTVDPIDLSTAYTGTGMASGAWAASKTVTGSVAGSGTALGPGSNNTILSAGGHWYFYTAGTTDGSTAPSHTSGSAADGTATAYYGGTVAAGVPMVLIVTWRQLEFARVVP